MPKSVGPDQTLCSLASGLGLHSLLSPVCSNTRDKYPAESNNKKPTTQYPYRKIEVAMFDFVPESSSMLTPNICIH